MKLKIIGSGGCVSTPRPCCSCKVCQEAREKGFPYARTGASLLICTHEQSAGSQTSAVAGGILIDTPEDINYALNNANISQVDTILYSHIDPDHTMGMRVIEQLRMDWLAESTGSRLRDPISVMALPRVLQDLKAQGTKYGSALEYYEARGLVTLKEACSFEKAGIQIDLIPANAAGTVAIFVISKDGKKVIYAPCDVKPFPAHPAFDGADVLIIGNTIVGNVLKDGFVLSEDNPLRQELFVMEEIIAIKEQYHIDRVIITHLEEDWGKSYDDYKELEKQYSNITFAYDGMEVAL